MALRSLMLKKKIDAKEKELKTLRAAADEIEKREFELEAAIEEAAKAMEGADTDEAKAEAEEAQKVVEEEVEKFEADKKDSDEAIASAEAEAEELKSELAEIEAEAERKAKEGEKRSAEHKEIPEHKKEDVEMVKRDVTKNIETRAQLVEREDVKAYLSEVRSAIREKRAITNVGLTIPTVLLGIIRENVIDYSKLYKHISVRPVSGKARELVAGTIPEGIWTECCATLNEMSIGFNDVEVDCFKVGGYFKVCNAILEDSDLDLMNELLTAIGQAIGLALDKAILYGKNSNANKKMPLGVISRLAQTSEPADYPATARTWVDLHTSNIKTIAANKTGIDLFKEILLASGAMKGKYARGEKVWVMNETTYTKLKAEAMSINAAGAIVSGIEGTMPVVGGIVEVLEFVPDNIIIGGYFELYLLAERAGEKFAQSEHAFFIQDQTVFKGTARYDGTPVIAEGFVVIGIGGTTPDASMEFAPDAANSVDLASLTGVTLDPEFDAGTTTYTAATTNTSDRITAVAVNSEAKVSVTYNDDAVMNGGSIKWASGSSNVVKIKVEYGNSSKTYQITVTKS